MQNFPSPAITAPRPNARSLISHRSSASRTKPPRLVGTTFGDVIAGATPHSDLIGTPLLSRPEADERRQDLRLALDQDSCGVATCRKVRPFSHRLRSRCPDPVRHIEYHYRRHATARPSPMFSTTLRTIPPHSFTADCLAALPPMSEQPPLIPRLFVDEQAPATASLPQNYGGSCRRPAASGLRSLALNDGSIFFGRRVPRRFTTKKNRPSSSSTALRASEGRSGLLQPIAIEAAMVAVPEQTKENDNG